MTHHDWLDLDEAARIHDERLQHLRACATAKDEESTAHGVLVIVAFSVLLAVAVAVAVMGLLLAHEGEYAGLAAVALDVAMLWVVTR